MTGGDGRVSLVQDGQALSVHPGAIRASRSSTTTELGKSLITRPSPGGIRAMMPSTLPTTVLPRIGHSGHTRNGQRVLHDAGKFTGIQIRQ